MTSRMNPMNTKGRFLSLVLMCAAGAFVATLVLALIAAVHVYIASRLVLQPALGDAGIYGLVGLFALVVLQPIAERGLRPGPLLRGLYSPFQVENTPKNTFRQLHTKTHILVVRMISGRQAN